MRLLTAGVYVFAGLVVLLTLRPVGQLVMLALRRRETPAAFHGPTVAAAVAMTIVQSIERKS